MTTRYSPRASRLPIFPINRENFLKAIVRFEKSNGEIGNRCILSLKDICTRRLLLYFGDDHQMYKTYLSVQLVHYVTYDYLTTTNNTQYQLLNDNQILSESKMLCCRDCSSTNLGASKCRRRKCLANRVRQILDQLSNQIIPWDKRKVFAIMENNDEDDDDPVIFIHLKSSKYTCQKQNDQYWIEDQFYLLDLLRILHINIYRE